MLPDLAFILFFCLFLHHQKRREERKEGCEGGWEMKGKEGLNQGEINVLIHRKFTNYALKNNNLKKKVLLRQEHRAESET